MTTHDLNISHKDFNTFKNGLKNLELSSNDGCFAVDDVLMVREMVHGCYTGRYVVRKIIHVAYVGMHRPGHIILTME